MDAEDRVKPQQKKQWTARKKAFVALAVAAAVGAVAVITLVVIDLLAAGGTPIIIKGDDSGANSLTVEFNAYDGSAATPASSAPAGAEHPVKGSLEDLKITTTGKCMYYEFSEGENIIWVYTVSDYEEIKVWDDGILWWKKIRSKFDDTRFDPARLVDNPSPDYDWWRFVSTAPRDIESVKIDTTNAPACYDQNNNSTTCITGLPDTNWPAPLLELTITINGGTKCQP